MKRKQQQQKLRQYGKQKQKNLNEKDNRQSIVKLSHA